MSLGFQSSSIPFAGAHDDALRSFCPHLADEETGGSERGSALPKLTESKGESDLGYKPRSSNSQFTSTSLCGSMNQEFDSKGGKRIGLQKLLYFHHNESVTIC